jgi:alkylation response protein AidB-like acyl-CoA dehydrogenase
MDQARATCDTYLPGLCAALAEIPLADLERPGNPGLTLFREHGGPALVIPKSYGGLGATPADAIRIMRAVGAASPSLAVATAMHHFSVATIFTLAESLRSGGTEWAVLEGIADQSLLVSSGFAEGRPGQGILSPSVSATRADGGFVVNGSKRPCSMASSMDLLSASVAVPTPDGGTELVLMLIPAATPGVSVHPFWGSEVLAGAESDEIRLTDVFVDQRLATRTEISARGEVDELQTVGFMWFEMLITSCYLGMASALAERAFSNGRRADDTLASLGIRLEMATTLLDSIARTLTESRVSNAALADTMIARYGAQDAINEVATMAVAALGGVAYITEPEIAYLAAACRCVSFHPPSRPGMGGAIAEYLSGGILRFG